MGAGLQGRSSLRGRTTSATRNGCARSSSGGLGAMAGRRRQNGSAPAAVADRGTVASLWQRCRHLPVRGEPFRGGWGSAPLPGGTSGTRSGPASARTTQQAWQPTALAPQQTGRGRQPCEPARPPLHAPAGQPGEQVTTERRTPPQPAARQRTPGAAAQRLRPQASLLHADRSRAWAARRGERTGEPLQPPPRNDRAPAGQPGQSEPSRNRRTPLPRASRRRSRRAAPTAGATSPRPRRTAQRTAGRTRKRDAPTAAQQPRVRPAGAQQAGAGGSNSNGCS